MFPMQRFVLASRCRFAAATILVLLTCTSALAGSLCTGANPNSCRRAQWVGRLHQGDHASRHRALRPFPGPDPPACRQRHGQLRGCTMPAGYVKDLPPQQLIGPAPVLSEWLVVGNSCTAVCTPLFVDNNWPCGCPYGQKLDPATRNCASVCAGSAVWQHSPGFIPDPNGYGKQDEASADALRASNMSRASRIVYRPEAVPARPARA